MGNISYYSIDTNKLKHLTKLLILMITGLLLLKRNYAYNGRFDKLSDRSLSLSK